MKFRSRALGFVFLIFVFNAIPIVNLAWYYFRDGCFNVSRYGKVSLVCGDEAKYWIISIFLGFNAFLISIILGLIRQKKLNK